jgi:hypothetical protein
MPKKVYLLPVWAPRVKPLRIRRLYEMDALGACDEELLDEVVWGLRARCQSFLEADAAVKGQVRCPACAGAARHIAIMLRCDACGWECPLRAYLATIRNQQLSGGPEVAAFFQEFVSAFPLAAGAPQKMLLIDRLIHGFHHYLTSGRSRRPVAVNLIDGDLGFVITFLDQLAYGPGSSPESLQAREVWRAKLRPPAHPRRQTPQPE